MSENIQVLQDFAKNELHDGALRVRVFMVLAQLTSCADEAIAFKACETILANL